jgi:predicted PurR-regulated permease PerM
LGSISVTRATVKGTFLIGIVQGSLGGIIFAVLGIPGAALWGLMMTVLWQETLVPNIA